MAAKKHKKLETASAPTSEAISAPVLLTRSFSIFLLLLVGINGGAVMLLELLGTRMLAPVFGSSLYIWTALISVTLLSLVIGYPLGGWVADKFLAKNLSVLFATTTAAAAWLMGLVLGQDYLLGQFVTMGAKSGPLVASVCLFTVPLVLLAMTGPLAIKGLTSQLGKLGITVGKVSAISTLGSLTGTVLSGFYLLPEVGIWPTVWYLSFLLLGMAMVGLVWLRKFPAVLPLVVLVLLNLSAISFDEPTPRPPRQIVFKKSSAYSDARVVDTHFQKPGAPAYRLRILFLGHGFHTVQFRELASNKPVFPALQDRDLFYWDALRLLPFLNRDCKNCLIIGLGGGLVVDYLETMGIRDVDAVEIDPVVVQIAAQYFNCRLPAHKIFIQDGRQYIKNCATKYDLIILDAFGAGTAPAHLYSLEALQEMKALLTEQGVLITNYIGFLDKPLSAALDAFQFTIHKVFPHQLVVSPSQDNNFIFFSSNYPWKLDQQKTAHLHADDRYFWQELLQHHRRLAKTTDDVQVTHTYMDRYLNIQNLIPQVEQRAIRDGRNFLEKLHTTQNDYLRQEILQKWGDIFLAGWRH